MSTVDPEIKKKLDQTIQEARQALEVINEDANNLAAEEREIRAEEALFKKTFVCRFCASRKVNALIISIGRTRGTKEGCQ
jgi:histidinol-phosphate/aromatic aminotransferase/cobyric acid decarboxylase-like protein